MTHVVLQSVTKQFAGGMVAVNGVDVTINSGELTAVIGPSGAGKSTLFRLINGLEQPSSGAVLLQDHSTTSPSRSYSPDQIGDLRGKVGTVFQHYNLVGRLSVMTNVLTGRLYQRSWLGSMLYLFRDHDYDIAAKALDRVGLLDRAWDRADKLSGGQQQRVGIARALAQQAKVLLADEPVSSLDPANSEQIMAILADLCRQDGITTIINLHQVELAKRYAQRIIGLRNGHVVFDGSPEQLTDAQLTELYRLSDDAYAPMGTEDGEAKLAATAAESSRSAPSQAHAASSPAPGQSAAKSRGSAHEPASWQRWPGGASS